MEGSEGHQRKSLVSFNIIFSHLRATNNTLCTGDVYKLYTKHRNIIGHLFLLNNDIPNPLGALQDMWSGHLQQITEKMEEFTEISALNLQALRLRTESKLTTLGVFSVLKGA